MDIKKIIVREEEELAGGNSDVLWGLFFLVTLLTLACGVMLAVYDLVIRKLP